VIIMVVEFSDASRQNLELMQCHVMSCHVMSCHVMSCYVMSCDDWKALARRVDFNIIR
jgi:extradiol dioxygenase family protein